jgi:hypothetical protein
MRWSREEWIGARVDAIEGESVENGQVDFLKRADSKIGATGCKDGGVDLEQREKM